MRMHEIQVDAAFNAWPIANEPVSLGEQKNYAPSKLRRYRFTSWPVHEAILKYKVVWGGTAIRHFIHIENYGVLHHAGRIKRFHGMPHVQCGACLAGKSNNI